MTATRGAATIRQVTGRVLIVDDHRGFRVWARRLLEQAGYVAVGEAADGSSAIQEAHRLRPDVVLLDVRLPDTDGFAVARQLCDDEPAPAVILTSTRDALDYGRQIQDSCALGFLPKADLSADAIARMLDMSKVSNRDHSSPPGQ